MATIQGLTKDRMLEIEAASVTGGHVDGNGDLILTTHGGDTQNAGTVRAPNYAIASETVQGIVELATPAETFAQADNTRAVTPLGLLTALKGDVLPANSDCDTLINSRTWIVLANPSSIKNWVGQGIPTSYTADANNPAGSYISPQSGVLRVHNDSGTIRQDAETTLGGSMIQTLHFSRSSLDGGTTWGPWRLTDGPLSAYGPSEQFYLGLYSKPSRRNIITMHRSDLSMMPYSLVTPDGIQYYRDSSQVRSGSPCWSALTLASPFIPYGGGAWTIAATIRTHAGIVTCRGLVKTASGAAYTNGTPIATLPPGYRPAQAMMFSTAATDAAQATLVSVDAAGVIRYEGSNSSNPTAYVSLDCIIFPAADVAPVNAWTNVTLGPGWTVYGGATSGFGQPGYWQDMYGRVWMRGMIGNASIAAGADNLMFSIPVALKTNLQIHAAAPAWTGSLFVSIHWLNGQYTYKVGNPTGNLAWLSLAQFFTHPVSSIPESAWRSILLTNGWADYGVTSFPGAGVWSAPDGLQHTRGLVRSGSIGGTVAMSAAMGVNDRTPYAAMWITSSNNTPARWNLNDYIANAITTTSGQNQWYSLDGGHYFLEA